MARGLHFNVQKCFFGKFFFELMIQMNSPETSAIASTLLQSSSTNRVPRRWAQSFASIASVNDSLVNRTAGIAAIFTFGLTFASLWLVSPSFVCENKDALSISQPQPGRVAITSLIFAAVLYVLVDFV